MRCQPRYHIVRAQWLFLIQHKKNGTHVKYDAWMWIFFGIPANRRNDHGRYRRLCILRILSILVTANTLPVVEHRSEPIIALNNYPSNTSVFKQWNDTLINTSVTYSCTMLFIVMLELILDRCLLFIYPPLWILDLVYFFFSDSVTPLDS